MSDDNFQISMAAARVNARLSQDQVAEALHITKQTLVNWEKGRSEPKVQQARALSEMYGISLDHIFLPSSSN